MYHFIFHYYYKLELGEHTIINNKKFLLFFLISKNLLLVEVSKSFSYINVYTYTLVGYFFNFLFYLLLFFLKYNMIARRLMIFSGEVTQHSQKIEIQNVEYIK